MAWSTIDNGTTIGTQGSADGVVERDEEHSDGSRITLERDCSHAPFGITCGIYGWMFHTRYFGTAEAASEALESMKTELEKILTIIPLEGDPESDAKCARVVDAIQEFVARFP